MHPLVQFAAFVGAIFLMERALMGHSDATYVIFDGDNDQWAYRYMRGWKANENIDFNFQDAHDLIKLTDRAEDERYIKARLRERMELAKQVIVLVGEHTKHLYRFVRWEMELAVELDLPIIAVNLNGKRHLDSTFCPPIIRDRCTVHIPFKMAIIKYALDDWPRTYNGMSILSRAGGAHVYKEVVYERLGI